MASNFASASVEELEVQLNSFDSSIRKQALTELAGRIDCGELRVSPLKQEVNLHFHTFFSYNGEGWSPSRIAWESRKYGLAAAGIVDFDVLDGMEEFLAAGVTIGLKTTAAMETRVFVSEFSDQVINSPNEPGISYFMASGCYKNPDEGGRAAEILQSMRDMAKQRNLQVMEIVNDYLNTVKLDYDLDIASLTPSGNVTERHMLSAYDNKAREIFAGNSDALASFWAKALGISEDDVTKLLIDTPAFHEKMRAKLMKFGGVGYASPTPETFPAIETVIEMINGMNGMPMLTWLDGTNPGESDMPSAMKIYASKGIVAINIVPDRNWNIKNPEEKAIKVANLEKCIVAARDMDFPICVGTEMNKLGLPFVDDFSAPELQPYIADFIDGAYFFWGHTFLARYADMGYASKWANTYFGDDRRKKNEFYTKIGRIAHPTSTKPRLVGINLSEFKPEEIVRMLQG